jgi:hypothetical protein
MARHYVEVVGLPITLDTKITLTGAPVVEIHYKTPNGVEGQWIGSVVDITKILYTTQVGDIPAADHGMWEFLAYVELSGGFKGVGEPVSVYFNQKWV